MKNNKATENYYLKEPPCNHGNNALNKCSSYFDINQFKQLYTPQSVNGYEQIFSPPRKDKKAGRKSKKEISNSKGAIHSFQSGNDKTNKINQINKMNRMNQYQNDTRNSMPVGIGERKKMKFNVPNEDPHCFYSNSFDQTPRKHFSFNHIHPQNDESPNVSNPSSSVRKGLNKPTISRDGSLNKYDFIRFVCSPIKKSADNRSAKCDSEMCSPAKNSTTRNDPKYDRKRNRNCGEHTAISMAPTYDPERIVDNYSQWDNIFYPKRDQQNALKTDQNFNPQNYLKTGANYGEHIATRSNIENVTKRTVNNYTKGDQSFDPTGEHQNASQTEQKFAPQYDFKRGATYTRNVTHNNEAKNNSKETRNTCSSWDQFFDPRTDPQNDFRTNQNFDPQDDLKGGKKYAQNITQRNDTKIYAKCATLCVTKSYPKNDPRWDAKNTHKTDPHNESIFHPKGSARCGERVGTNETTNDDTAEDPKSDIKNFPKNCPPNDQYNGTNQSSESDQESTPQNGALNNELMDLDSHDSIDRLSRNFFINKKKIFITHFRKEKDAHSKRASSHPHSNCGNVPLPYDAPEGGRNKGKNEHNKWKENAEQVTPGGETLQYSLFAKVNSSHCEDYVNSGEENCAMENSIRENYRARGNRAERDDYNEDDEHHNHDTGYSDEEPPDGSSFLRDMDSFVRKNCNVTKSLYNHLDVPYNGSKEEIKKSYKEKIKVHHPDKGGSINKFLQLKLSYDILTNDKKRKMYDKYGHSILELLVSEKFQNYEISSSDGENSENEIDDDNVKIYDLFVQKYNNTSYLHNLHDLKMDSNQYNEFQKLIFHFFHHENPMFTNTFHLFPAYSPFVPPYRKKKTDKRKADKIKAVGKEVAEKEVAEKEAVGKEVEKKTDKERISNLGLSSSMDTSSDCFIRRKELLSSEDSSTSRNDSPSNYSETKECSIYDVLSIEHVTNLFNELDDDFKYFYKKCIVYKIEESELANNSKYGKKGLTKIVNPGEDHHEEGKANVDDTCTPVKEHTPHPFEQSPYDEDVATPLAQCQASQERHIPNGCSRNERAHFFRDIQTSPIAYKIIKENDERHIAEFYRWFELFFSHHEEAQAASEATKEAEREAANEAVSEVANHAIQSDQRICSDIPPNSRRGAGTPTAAAHRRPQSETHSARSNDSNAEINSERFRTFQSCAEKSRPLGQMMRCSTDTPNAQVNSDAQNWGSPARFAHDNNGKTKHRDGGGSGHFQTHPETTAIRATPSRANTTPRKTEKKGEKPNRCREKDAHKITPLRSMSTKVEDNNLALNIEEKYGFNLLKRSEQKIKDMTHDFNYIYIGTNMMKKNKFVLFVKEESIKRFLKVKLLIEKIKKKSNLKLISVFENEIEKNIKDMEYILLLTTHKDEFLPLNDFYLLDRNVFTKDHYCIPIYIKKNSISRPTHFHMRWIVYTIQSLIFFNFFFKKVNKYMCAFPFFNYKYNLLKQFFHHEEKSNNTIPHDIKNFYIFFQQYIIKNKRQYLKYFPHSIILQLENDASVDYQSKKPVRVNMSSILVLTSNKPIPSAQW
ncbi:hypothetical protein C922_02248 [Plasmodium inui San Antonio 1]|uniref:J domain-containing protein n=1 Tax=Plasmodium inui San Antonio 1 TaxID=1237626 RepID=W7A2V7_9APIC|nr:hypothetical protein C922_02248 [Plasmodium inui San Antonio 1]EUD67542.1 hypothetical protein C922_02248 [Plasmodium inui San Antonio 1]